MFLKKIFNLLLSRQITSSAMQRLEIAGAVMGLIGLFIALISVREQLYESRAQNEIRRSEVILRSFETIRIAKENHPDGNIGQVEAVENLVNLDASLSNFDFSEMYLKNTNFKNADLRGTNFKKAYLRGADFSGANIEGGNFSEVHLGAVTLPKTGTADLILLSAEFGRQSPTIVNLGLYNVYASQFGGLDFFSANLDKSYSRISPFVIAGSDLSYSTMKSVKFDGVIAPFSEFTAVNMTEASFRNAVFSGSVFQNGSCDGGGGTIIEDCDANLYLRDVDFTGANLTGAEFIGDIKYGENQNLFSKACYSKLGIKFTFIVLDCTKSTMPITGISILVEGPPLIPKQFSQVQECTETQNSRFNAQRVRNFFIPTHDKNPSEIIDDLQNFAEEHTQLTAKRVKVSKKDYCYKGDCSCPQI